MHARPGHEVDALQKVNELIEQGMLCEFSVFEELPQSMDYARARNIGQVYDVGDEVKILEI